MNRYIRQDQSVLHFDLSALNRFRVTYDKESAVSDDKDRSVPLEFG